MTPESRKRLIYALIGLGFAGLIGAHEVAVTPPIPVADSPGADSNMTVPFILAAVGTLSFVVAGLMAFRLLKGK